MRIRRDFRNMLLSSCSVNLAVSLLSLKVAANVLGSYYWFSNELPRKLTRNALGFGMVITEHNTTHTHTPIHGMVMNHEKLQEFLILTQ
uniref:Putative secreted protein n=1 Tax=Anopheles darlingi TaxID=43151 RepID=A0A2M4DK27_ANODA